MKKTILFCFVVILTGAMIACSSNPFNGYLAISTEEELVAFLEKDSEETTLAYLTKDISIISGESLIERSGEPDSDSVFVVKGNKTINLNHKTITATVTLSETSTNYVVQSWPNITGFALIKIDEGAKLTLKDGTVETEFSGTVSAKDVSPIDKYYFETIQNQGEFVAEKTTITCKTDTDGVKTPTDIKSSVSGVFNRNKVTTYTVGAKLPEVKSTIKNCTINAENTNGEANAIASWASTESSVTGSTLNAKGSDSSKGVFLLGHEGNGNKNTIYSYDRYPITLSMKNCKVSVVGNQTKARGVFVLTSSKRSNDSICATLDDVSFTLTGTTTNLIKVEDEKRESTTSVKVTGTSVSILNDITATVEFIPSNTNKANVNINGIKL